MLNTEKLELLRRKALLSQKELSKRIGISSNAYNNAIKRGDFKTSILTKIANELKVPVSFLFDNNLNLIEESQSNTLTNNHSDSTTDFDQDILCEELKLKMKEQRKNTLFYWDLTEGLIEIITDVYVKLSENDASVHKKLIEFPETRRFIASLNTVKKLTDDKVIYNDKFFNYFENPY